MTGVMAVMAVMVAATAAAAESCVMWFDAWGLNIIAAFFAVAPCACYVTCALCPWRSYVGFPTPRNEGQTPSA